MKKLLSMFAAIILIAVCLCGCGNTTYLSVYGYTLEKTMSEKDITVYSVTEGANYIGETCMFEGENTLVFKEESYRYYFNGTNDTYTLDITYPHGEMQSYSYKDNIGSKSGELNPVYGKIVYDSDFIHNVIVAKELENTYTFRMWLMIVAIIVAVIGLFQIVAPKAVLFLCRRWVKIDSESTESAIMITRFFGSVLFVASFAMAYYAIVG